MKVVFDDIEKGIANYLDKEFLNQYESTSFQRAMLGVAISLFLNKKSQEIKNMISNGLGKTMGISDDDGMIDIDLLKDTIKQQITEEGIKYKNPYIGTITFHKDDVDVLYKYVSGELQ